jgi:hypothetical protein
MQDPYQATPRPLPDAFVAKLGSPPPVGILTE